ncbi:MAG TPA: FCD domain-containing protein [Microbacteriaceae bacterium]|nr:FCD domain-containing protein [Microbacteriaceae bacterium]
MTTEQRRGPSQAQHERILDALGEAIVAGRLAAGERLLAAEIAERYRASRSTVREAVRVLESMGMAQSRRNVGVEILPAERWNSFSPRLIEWRLAAADRLSFLHSLSELRSAIEPLAARLAAQQASAQQCAALVMAAKGMREAASDADGPTYLDHDMRFHETLLESSHNPLLLGLKGVVAEVLRGRTRHALMPHDADPSAVRLHQAVAARVSEGDAAGAEDAMRAIIAEADTATARLGTTQRRESITSRKDPS